MKKRRNLAAAAGRWSAQHRWAAVSLWLLLIAVATVIGSAIKPNELTLTDQINGEAQRAQTTLRDAGFDLPSREVVFVHSDQQTAQSPRFRSGVEDVVAALDKTGRARDVLSPLEPTAAGAISADQHSALVQFNVDGDPLAAKEHIQGVLDAVAAVQRDHTDLRIEQFGEASFQKAYDDKLDTDFANAELLSIPVTLVILLFAFAAVVAAVLPLVLAFSAVLAAGGIVALTSHVVPTDVNASSVMALIGIAVGVDYSLFYIRRTREERARGLGPRAAVEAAAATSGRAIIVSGLAVMIAMGGMFFSRNGIQAGMASATITVVAVAVVGSVTVLPALLSLLGDRADRGRVPLVNRFRRTDRKGGGWERVLGAVLRRPAASVVVFGALLVALALPALSLHTSNPGFADLPADSMPALQTNARVQEAFPGTPAPAKVVLSGADVNSPAATAAIDAFTQRATAQGDLRGPVSVERNPDHTVALLTVGLAGDGTDDTSVHALSVLRGQVIPQTVGKISGVHASVTGITAASVDTNRQLSHATPFVAGFVLLLTFAIMLFSFRSLVIAGLTMVLNLLSVGTAYGVVVLVFQRGWGSDLLGFQSRGGITSWVPLFMFVVLFGLSMDYHVFVVSRIREAHDRGLPTAEAIAQGISRSAGVVTSAAIVMVAVAGVFGTLPQLSMKEAGVGMATAILIDATVIRAVLLPATMKLLGESTWYLPRWMGWLPELSHDSAPAPRPHREEQPTLDAAGA